MHMLYWETELKHHQEKRLLSFLQHLLIKRQLPALTRALHEEKMFREINFEITVCG